MFFVRGREEGIEIVLNGNWGMINLIPTRKGKTKIYQKLCREKLRMKKKLCWTSKYLSLCTYKRLINRNLNPNANNILIIID